MKFQVFRYGVAALMMVALMMPIIAFYAGILSGLLGVPVVPYFEFGLAGDRDQYQVPALCGKGSVQSIKEPCNWRQISFAGPGGTDYLVRRCRTPQRYWHIVNRAEACSRNHQFAGAVMLYMSAAEEAKSERNPFIQAVVYARLHELSLGAGCAEADADADQIAAGYVREIVHLLPDLTDEEKMVVLSCIRDRVAYEVMIPLVKKFYGGQSRLHQYYVSRLAQCEADLGNWQKSSQLMVSITRYHQGLHLSVLADCLFHSKRYAEAAWCYRRWKSFGWSLPGEQLADWRAAEQACGEHVVPVDFYYPRVDKEIAERFTEESPWTEPQPIKEELHQDARRAGYLLTLGELAMQLKLKPLARGQIVEAARLIATIPRAERNLVWRCLSDLLQCIDQESDPGEAGKLSHLFWAVSGCIDHMESVSWQSNGWSERWGSPTYNLKEKIMMVRNDMFKHTNRYDAQDRLRELYQQYERLGLHEPASRVLQSVISLEQQKSRKDYGMMSRDAWLLVSLNLSSWRLVETVFCFGFAEGAATRQSYVDYKRWQDSFDYFD